MFYPDEPLDYYFRYFSSAIGRDMNKVELLKGLKRLSFFLLFAFLGPIILNQAFKNQTHPFYIPVLVAGGLCCLAALGFGFAGIQALTNGLLGKPPKK